MYGRAGTIPIPTAVGPHLLKIAFWLLAHARPTYLTAVWIVKAGKAIEATP